MTLVAVSNTSNGGDHDDDGGRQQLQVEAEMVIYLFVCCLWLEQGHGGLGLGLIRTRLGLRAIFNLIVFIYQRVTHWLYIYMYSYLVTLLKKGFLI